MATQADVRKIALSLPGAEETPGRFAFSVLNKGKAKGFVWVWMERIDPRKARVPNAGVIAVRVANLAQKDLILASDSGKFFTEPHYNGFPAVLVRLAAATKSDLQVLIEEAWRCQAPADLVGGPQRKPAAKRGASSAAKSAGRARTPRKRKVR